MRSVRVSMRMLNDIYQLIDPVIVSVGPLSVRWYGVAYVVGFILAGLVVFLRQALEASLLRL